MKPSHTEEIIALLWFILAWQIPDSDKIMSIRNFCLWMGFLSMISSTILALKGEP